MITMSGYMRYFMSVVMFLSLFSSCESNNLEKSGDVVESIQKKERVDGVIVALGDSLTAGYGVELQGAYPALLQNKLEADGYRYKVVNAGVSAETTSGTLSRLDWILSQKPDIILLVIGANDGLRGIDIQLIRSNLEAILTRLKDEGIVTVLGGMMMVWNLGEEYTLQYNAIYPQMAEKFELIYMPFFLEDVAAVAALNRADGIHPNERGYEIITDNIYPYVLKAIARAKDLPRNQ